MAKYNVRQITYDSLTMCLQGAGTEISLILTSCVAVRVIFAGRVVKIRAALR